MLILSRRKGEAIMIGDHIEARVLAMQGQQVKIGIQAPREIGIYREELYQKPKKMKEE